MTRLALAVIWCSAVLTVAPLSSPLSAQATTDSLRREVRELQRQVAALAVRQAATDSVLRRVSELLAILESRSNSASSSTTNCGAGRSSSNPWIRVSVNGCATIAPDGESISFILSLSNASNDTLYIGAECCYPDKWLGVVDDRGQRWEGSQFSVSTLPTTVSRNYSDLAPGAEILLNVSVTHRPPSRMLIEVPSYISVTLSLMRRTANEQRIADRAATASGYPHGRPFTAGVSQVPVNNRPPASER
jgi:hypothetical protein